MGGLKNEKTRLISQIEVLDDTGIFKECVPASPDGSQEDDDNGDDFTSHGGLKASSITENDDDYLKPLSMPTNSTGRNGTTSNGSSTAGACRWAGWTARTILLDVPMLVIVAMYCGILWLDHVHDNYLFPQIQASIFNDDRREEESTYYSRSCDERDISTTNGADLFLPANATAHEAYLHQLKHGFTIFRSALSPETAKNLRDYVVSKNYKLPEEESIFVIEGDKRYSFGLGTEEPSVAAAVMELTNSKQLKESIAKIMGPDPALIEMTAITASYGAVSQYFHDDVFAVASTVRYARTFAPSYSLFIQLQNTTKEMGATAACPGTIYCSGPDGTTMALCEKVGFQLVNEDGHWAEGDALLMNHNSFHRGEAHTDPNAPDRVMFILTFTTKPRSQAETRQLSQGITFSLRWDMWGHTFRDLANADIAMTQPWATLRALGLYKPKDAAWGLDYITGSIMRMANSDNGFDGYSMGQLLKRGGLRYIPDWLQEPIEDWGDDDFLLWHKFLLGTFIRIKYFWTCLAVFSPLVYLLVFRQQSKLSFWQATRRLAFMCTIVCTLLLVWRRHVDSTQWAKDIRADRRFSNSMDNEAAFLDSTGCITSAFPNRNDVLMENRLGSSYLHMYEDFIPLGHPGNHVHSKMVQDAAPFYSANRASNLFRKATAQYIVDAIAINNHGRFLKQGFSGSWCWADQKTALRYTTKMLASASNPALGVVLKEIRHAISECRFGIYRNSSLSSKHAAPFLRKLEAKLLIDYATPTSVTKTKSQIHPGTILYFNDDLDDNKRAGPIRPKFKPTPPHKGPSENKATLTRTLSSFKIVPTEPEPGAWISEFSRVEGVVDEHWYIGTVTFVDAHGMYFVEYADGISDMLDRSQIRPIVPHQVGEELQVLVADDKYFECIIVSMDDNATYHAYVYELDMYMENVVDSSFRRQVQEGEIEERQEYVRKYN